MQAVDTAARRVAAEALGDEVCELAALTHAATAELVRKAAAFDDAEGWAGDGIRSCAPHPRRARNTGGMSDEVGHPRASED